MIYKIRPLLLLISAVSFGLGITLPLVQFKKLYFFSDTPSLLGIVAGLWNEGSGGLAIIVVLFSLLFPMVKLWMAFQSAICGNRLPDWAGILSKWSMMDVLLVAIAIFAAKSSGLASAITQPGLWFYGLSAIALAVASIGLNVKKLKPEST